MTQRTIAVGESESYRYFGIEPPLDAATAHEVEKCAQVPKWLGSRSLQYIQKTDGDGPDYTEFYLNVGDALDWRGRDMVNLSTMDIANLLAQLLRRRGDSVSVLPDIIPTDDATPLFGEEADALRAEQQIEF